MAVDVRRFVSLFLHGESARADWSPATDIYRTPSGWLVKMELAGVRAEDLNISVRGRSIVVRGRRRDRCLAEGCQQLHMEITYDRFERSIELPADLQHVSIETSIIDGMLLIAIHREAGE
ncbi:MAG: Hsp20/alpha crystallin family protein [Gemmataceae bacterium]